MKMLSPLRSLSGTDLLSQFAELVQRDNRQVAASLRYIEEIDRRELWARYGHSSMFAMCVDRFRMSEDVAGKRIGVARVARRFPVIFAMVERGDISLSAVLALRAHFTEGNHAELLAEAKHKKMKEVERMVARIAPKPDVPTRITAVPQPKPAAPQRPATAPDAAAPAAPELDFTLDPQPAAPASAPAPASASAPASPGPARPRPPKRAADPTPLSERRFKLVMTMSEEAHANLERLQDLLAHQIPNGDPAQIVERALEVLLAQTLKKKAALTESPRAPKTESQTSPSELRTRAIPAHVRRAVWERDGGRCTFVGEDGRQCNETRGLEFGHGEAFAKGGEHSVGNVFLRCRGHNTHEAHRDYGRAFMDRKRSSPRHDHVREAGAVYGAACDPREAGGSRASTLVLRRQPRGCHGLDSEVRAVRRVKITREMGDGRAKLREASASPEARSLGG